MQEVDKTAQILLIASMVTVDNCVRALASDLSEDLACQVQCANGRRAGLQVLRSPGAGRFDIVVVEEALAESDPLWADAVWQAAGLAMPMQVNFALSGAPRLGRDLRAALGRLRGEHALMRRTVAAELENELKSSVTGLMLESELALREPGVSESLEPKLRHLVQLAGALRERLRTAAAA